MAVNLAALAASGGVARGTSFCPAASLVLEGDQSGTGACDLLIRAVSYGAALSMPCQSALKVGFSGKFHAAPACTCPVNEEDTWIHNARGNPGRGEANMDNESRADVVRKPRAAYAARREVFRQAASVTRRDGSPLAVEATLASISEEVTADAIERRRDNGKPC